MVDIAFLLNGDAVRLADTSPTRTLLDWLREDRGLTGTKEGCNEGDCGACTVMVTDGDGRARALNACILLLPQLNGKAVRTVEGIAGPDGQLHPVQDAMITHHASQCGFCTPGFVVSMAVAHKNGATNFDDQFAGNLCRCTGYAPIIRAAEAAQGQPVPNWMDDKPQPDLAKANAFVPATVDALATWYLDNPEATLIAGATDVGLWVTKSLKDLGPVAFLNQCDGLDQIRVTETEIRIGATAKMTDVGVLMQDHHPAFSEMIRRYGSVQVRNAATIGGNIANGSPIGDGPPALIALGARLILRKGDERREIAIEDFFIDYGRQDRAPGEFVQAIVIPQQADTLKVYKLSKRFDQDISAVCGAFNIVIRDDHVVSARIAFGGMAGTPKRAVQVEAALLDQPWSMATIQTAMTRMSADFEPMTDMRASADYRLTAAENMLMRCFVEEQGQNVSVLQVHP